MTFWAALKESLLERLHGGASNLAVWRAAEQRRKECERIAQHYLDEAAGRVMREDEYKIIWYRTEDLSSPGLWHHVK